MASAGDLLGPQSPLLGLQDKDFDKVVKLIQGATASTFNPSTPAAQLRKSAVRIARKSNRLA